MSTMIREGDNTEDGCWIYFAYMQDGKVVNVDRWLPGHRWETVKIPAFRGVARVDPEIAASLSPGSMYGVPGAWFTIKSVDETTGTLRVVKSRRGPKSGPRKAREFAVDVLRGPDGSIVSKGSVHMQLIREGLMPEL